MEHVKNFWDKMAKRYPRFTDPAMLKDVTHILSWCESNQLTFEHKHVLDIGSGTGTIAIPLMQKGAFVTATDISSDMIETLIDDAKAYALLERVETFVGDWDAFSLEKTYDIVIASMTPAISTQAQIDKMIQASKESCIYVGWGKYRNNHFVTALLKAHNVILNPIVDEPMSVAFITQALEKRGFAYKSTFFETSWSDEYAYEQAKEYAYEQLQRRKMTPNEQRVDDVIKAFTRDGKVIVCTQAEKGIVLWNVAK